MLIMCQGPYCDKLTDEAETFEAVVPHPSGDGARRIAVAACCLPHLESAVAIARESAVLEDERIEDEAQLEAAAPVTILAVVADRSGNALAAHTFQLTESGTDDDKFTVDIQRPLPAGPLTLQVERMA